MHNVTNYIDTVTGIIIFYVNMGISTLSSNSFNFNTTLTKTTSTNDFGDKDSTNDYSNYTNSSVNIFYESIISTIDSSIIIFANIILGYNDINSHNTHIIIINII
ncbi:MAG: hypothetical protein ACRC1M_03340 [Methanobacteriaceae archaeon]